MGDEVDDLLEVSPTEYSARQCAIAQRTLKFAMAFAALSKSRELEENALHDLGDEVLRRNDQTHVSGFDP